MVDILTLNFFQCCSMFENFYDKKLKNLLIIRLLILVFKVLFTWISLGLIISSSSTETLKAQVSRRISITLSLKFKWTNFWVLKLLLAYSCHIWEMFCFHFWRNPSKLYSLSSLPPTLCSMQKSSCHPGLGENSEAWSHGRQHHHI